MLKIQSNPLKYLLFFLIIATFSFANQRIFDEANLLEPKHEMVLERMIWEWETKTNHQMAIVTVKSLKGAEIEDYSVNLFEKLKIGDKDKNNGLLFIVAPNERRVRIEVGYGLEQYLPDGLVGDIQDSFIIPHFRNNDFATGIMQGTYALLIKQAEAEGIELPQLSVGELPKAPLQDVSQTQNSIAGFFVFLIIILILIKSRTARSILFWSLMASNVGGRNQSHNNFGSFGGGFGGFGGGLSGGGGASRRW